MIDTHCHVWDETCRFVAGTAYRPARGAAPWSELRALWDLHGVAGGVLVQPSFLGTDNAFLLRTIASDPVRLRGVVVVDPARDAARVATLHAQGIRGFRFNLLSAGPMPDMAEPAWRDFCRAARAAGWHAVLAGTARDLVPAVSQLVDAGLPIAIDHYGLPDSGDGVRCAHWRALLATARRHPIWFKLTAPYRLGGVPPGELADALVDALGTDRLTWGSDWPWTRYETGRSFDALLDVGLVGGTAHAVLGDTARRLYGFP